MLESTIEFVGRPVVRFAALQGTYAVVRKLVWARADERTLHCRIETMRVLAVGVLPQQAQTVESISGQMQFE